MSEQSKYWAGQHQYIINGNYQLLTTLRDERTSLEEENTKLKAALEVAARAFNYWEKHGVFSVGLIDRFREALDGNC